MQKHAGLTARAFTQALQGGLANMQRLRCPTVRSVGILQNSLRPFRPVNLRSRVDEQCRDATRPKLLGALLPLRPRE
jgi:hypothetical protein